MKRDKVILMAAGAMVLVGAVVSTAAVALGSAAEKDSREIKEYPVSANVSKINIASDYDDINVVGTDTGKIKVTYCTSNITDYDISESNNILNIESKGKNNQKWYDFIDFDFGRDNEITVEVPKELQAEIVSEVELGDTGIFNISGSADIKNSCGDIEIASCDFTAMKCTGELGDIDIENIVSKSITVNQSCGDISIENTTGNAEIYCELGDINIDRISGDNIKIKNSCGDVEGTVVGNEGDYKITAETALGDNNLRENSTGAKTLDVSNECGDINIKFTK